MAQMKKSEVEPNQGEPAAPPEPTTAPEIKDAPPTKRRQSALNRSARLLVAKQQKEQADAIAKREEQIATNIYFLKCPRIAGHHAAYLNGPYEKGTVLTGADWFSVLKPEDVNVWTLPYIPCQECFVEGQTRKWSPHISPIRLAEGYGFKPNTRVEYVIGFCSRAEMEGRRESFNKAVGEKVI